MKIESFEIRFEQYLCVVEKETKRLYVFNLRETQYSLNMRAEKDAVVLYGTSDEDGVRLEADFDLSPIVDAFMLANLEK